MALQLAFVLVAIIIGARLGGIGLGVMGGIGLGVALLLNSGSLRGRKVFRSLLFLPWTIPSLVVAVTWMFIFQPHMPNQCRRRSHSYGHLEMQVPL